MASNVSVKTQPTTLTTSSVETTIVTANPITRTRLAGLIISCITAGAVGTLTVRSATGGAARLVIDFPSTAVVPTQPMLLPFSPSLEQREGPNNNWTIQSSSAANSFKVTAVYQDAE